MSKIVLKQTHIEINDYDMGDSPRLENTFSIYDRITHISYLKGIEYVQEQRKMLIPRGVDLYWVENIFNARPIIDSNYDKFDTIDPVSIKVLPRDDIQKEALRFTLGLKEYSALKNYNQKCLNLNTGKGKSYVSIYSCAYNRTRFIIITKSVGWLEQWRDYILEYTDIKANEIYFISGSSSIKRLLTRDVSKYKVFLVTHSTTKSYGDSNGWDSITELFKYLRVGMKIIDESHLNFDNVCKLDFYTNTYVTLYVTATPARSNEEENTIYNYYFKNVPSIDLFDQENDPRTKYQAFRYSTHPTPSDITNCKNQYGLDRNKYVSYVIEKENFHYMLHILMDKIKKINGKVLIYIGLNEAILFVYEWIKENYPEMIHLVGIYTSMTKENKELELEKKIILSTTKSCGAAVDIDRLKWTIVLAEPFKSEVLARQSLGRTRATNTIYTEIVDDGFYYTKKYYYDKKPVFEKYATECTEVKISDNELMNKATEIQEYYASLRHPIVFNEFGRMRKAVTFGK